MTTHPLKRATTVFVWLCAGLGFYVLSAGPVVFAICWVKGGPEDTSFERAVGALYGPARLSLGNAFDDYLYFCAGFADRVRPYHLISPPAQAPQSTKSVSGK
jgi:hypothetical protein